MIYFIDTNIFIRVLVKDNENFFEECTKLLNLIHQGKISAFISTLVFGEVEWVLRSFYKFEKEKVAESLDGILKLRNLKIIDKFNLSLALKLYKDFPVKFIDALIASNPLIFQKKAIVVSYDKDFDKIGVKRKEPKQIIKK